MGRKIFLDINNTINLYDSYIYINKVSEQNVESFSINLLISEILNERFKSLCDYSIVPFTTTSILGEDIYNIFYLRTMNKRYISVSYNRWSKNFLRNLDITTKEYDFALKNIINKIENYHSNPMNKNKILIKDKTYPNSLLGSKRLGSIDSLSACKINNQSVIDRIPIFVDSCNLNVSRVNGKLNVYKLNEIKYASPLFIPHIVKQEAQPLLHGQSINTICYYFENNDEYSKMIYGPMLQGYLTQYGHSVLFKKLRIDDYHLYHFEAHFDQESNILFIQYVVSKEWEVKVRNRIITEIMNLTISNEEFQSMKMFISNEYKFKFDKSFGELNYILGLGNKFFHFTNIFEVIRSITLQGFMQFIDNKKLINIIYEG